MVVKFGIIGCSKVAQKRFIPALCSSDLAELGSIGSRSLKKAETFASQFGCIHFGTYEDVLKSNVDAVYISLPVGLHEEWIVKASHAGKHVICEKSSTMSYQSAKRVVEASKKNNKRIFEDFSFRFHPQHQKVKEYLDKGLVGSAFNFHGAFGFPLPPEEDIRWKKELGGGALNDAACYPICASRMLFESEPIGVLSHLEYDDTHNVEIRANLFLQYPNSKTAFVAAGFYNYFQSTYTIWGTQAMISTKRAYAVPNDLATSVYLYQDDRINETIIPPADQFKLMIDNFCNEILGASSPTFNFEEELLAQARVMEAARQSDKENRFVFLREIG